MKIAFYLNVISPHQLPLACEVVRIVGEENFKYVYAEDFLADRKDMGWDDRDVPSWCMKGNENASELIDADLVYTGIRCVGLMAKRSAIGKKTAYYSERWFKPIPVLRFLIPGCMRLVSPSYWRMARQVVKLLNDSRMRYLPCGPWAAKDMLRIGLKSEQIVPWGYFVAPGRHPEGRSIAGGKLRVLWVGKILQLKRVDTVVRAISCLGEDVELTIVGDGPDKSRVIRLADGCDVTFLQSQPIDKIREIMRQHDVYVFSSNGMDGWGAVVNEALEEGMCVIGTKETGASAAILSDDAKYSCGDWRRLAQLINCCAEKKRRGILKGQGIGEWSAEKAALRLVNLFERRK